MEGLQGHNRMEDPKCHKRTHSPPLGETGPGATLAKMEQRDFYRILRSKRKMPERRTTDHNVEAIQDAPRETSNKRPTAGVVWLAMKHKDLKGETRDFL